MRETKHFGTTVLFAGCFGCLVLASWSQEIPSKMGREVAIPHHLQDGEEFEIPITGLIQFGEQLFTAKFTVQEGAGRPLSKGPAEALKLTVQLFFAGAGIT